MTERPDDATHPTHTEEAVDELEEKVLGHRVDQRRDQDASRPGDGQDVLPEADGTGATEGSGSEPSG
ncbi:hypothetical protein ACFQH9_01540 [Pseudonocardia lutea]|jgi:hypothetical protein|uniref:Uncharacterized protein n=1 Tax=Pseudonocardia lutea TaxID=2172015 RepID=A0ABW1I2J3_9PSEU